MNQVLEQLNSAPDVIGCLVCSKNGVLLGSSFPAIFESRVLDEASILIAGTGIDSGSSGLLDLRFSDGRIIVRRLDSGLLFILCTKAVNLQMLNISLNIATKRMNELLKPEESSLSVIKQQEQQEPTPIDQSFKKTPSVDVTPDSNPQIVIVDELDSSTEAGRGFQELGMAAVTASTSQQLCRCLNVSALKRVKLTQLENNSTGVFGLMVFSDDSGRYDGRIIISKHIEKKLSATKGDRLKADIA